MNETLPTRWKGWRAAERFRGARAGGRQMLRSGMEWLRQGLADVVFPPSCLSCFVELETRTGRVADFCAKCMEEMEVFAEPMCERCSAPLPVRAGTGVDGLAPVRKVAGCDRCRGRKLWFDATIALGHYAGRLRELILRMKDYRGDSLSLAMGRLLGQVRGERLRGLGVDVVTPIPLHWRRRLAHRTNSSALVAEVLSDELNLPRADGLLRRARHTRKQFELSPTARWENVRRAFVVRPGYHLRDAHVLVCDDILTTGATCSEAARALREAGAGRVTIVVAARAFGEMESLGSPSSRK